MERHEMTARGSTEEARDVAIDAALQAGAYIRAQYHQARRVTHKGVVDLVTQVDVEAERLIVSRLRASFPDHGILAEESPGAFAMAPARWIVDPLDGTTNFVHGVPHVAVSIGLEVSGRLEVGVIYDPHRDELFVAARGEGAYLNGRRIRVAQPVPLAEALLATGFPYDRRVHAAAYLAHVQAFMEHGQGIRRMGAAALDLAWVACGRYNGFWEFKLKPWDIAAGIVLVEEAGGVVSRRDGNAVRLDGGEIVAGHADVVAQMLPVMVALPDPLH